MIKSLLHSGLFYYYCKVFEPSIQVKAPCSSKIFKNSERIVLVVGRILSLINQGSAILAGTSISWNHVAWNHVALNYLVPYCAASYSAAKNELTQRANQ